MSKIWPIPVFNDNYVWVLENENNAAVAVVDPGDGLAVLGALEQRQLEPIAVLVTHHHADHVGGIDEIVEHNNLPVFGPATETIANVDHPVSDGDTLKLTELDLEVDVLHVPGHTAGHVAYVARGSVLCGDALFAGGCGRIFEGTARQMYDSLQRLAALDPDTAVYCAHEYTVANLRFAREVEPNNTALLQRLSSAERFRDKGQPTVPSVLREELATNPFLRSHVPEVRKAAEEFAGRSLIDDVEVFATVRSWKDGWKS